MTDRRYDDEEVAAIFQKAAEGPQAFPLQRPGDEGLTLADLQDIGREVGISPEAVAQAAVAVDRLPKKVSRRFLGFPMGVERTVVLGRWLTDAEWERLVVELREVFNAQGTMSSSGSLRQWTNGNLQALLEPTETGHRLRLKTMKGSARAQMTAGFATLGITAAESIASASGGQFVHAVPGTVLLFLVGIGMIANAAIRLPSWARLRGRQMDDIAARLMLPSPPERGTLDAPAAPPTPDRPAAPPA